ncbi:MAG: gliding motility-associated C-terminal domain-containing protein, partial [Chitinophagaceae bacterium]
SFSVNAAGTNLNYQWQSSTDRGGTWVNINGETKDTLTIKQAVMTNNNEQYRVIINGTCGNIISNPAILTINNQPTSVTTQPVNKTVCDSSNVIFSVAATGPTLSYQWQSSADSITWTNINGAVKDTLVLDTVTTANNGTFYRAVVSSFCQNTFSEAARLTVNANTIILVQPSNQGVCDSGNATFKMSASGTNVQYQWQILTDSAKWKNISGANADSLTLSDIDSTVNGTQYRVIVTGTCGMVISDSVRLNVYPITIITLQPVKDTACAGGNAQFKVIAIGNNVQYQWQSSPDGKAWSNISGGNDTTLSISDVPVSDSGIYYRALVTSSCANLVSDSAMLIVGSIPSISITPQLINPVPLGVLTRLTASGAQSYQWSNSPGIQNGWTDSVLSIVPTQEATYTVTGISALGCSSQQSYSIQLMTDKSLIVNNIVSPNGDGKNDTWFIKNITSFPNNEVMIYDRAGRMIFHQKNYDNQWNGILNGTPLREGTYYYIFIVNNGGQVFKGFIELLNNQW